MLYFVPGKVRKILDTKWRRGVYLGHALSSNESYIGTASGGDIRARSIHRLPEEERWDAEAVIGIRGNPARPRVSLGDGINRDVIEESPRPHARDEPTYDPNEESLDMPGLPEPVPREQTEGVQDIERLTTKRGLRLYHEDFKKYGYGDRCNKCQRYANRQPSKGQHSMACRHRMYLKMWRAQDPKLIRVLSTEIGRERLRWKPPDDMPSPDSLDEDLDPNRELEDEASSSESTESSSSSSSSSSSEGEANPPGDEEQDAEEEDHDAKSIRVYTITNILQTLGMNSVEAGRTSKMLCSIQKTEPPVSELYMAEVT